MPVLSPRRRRVRRAWLSVAILTVAAGGVTFALGGLGGSGPDVDLGNSGISRDLERTLPPDHPRVTFRERARQLGVDLVHGSGQRSSLLPEDMGPGLVLEDLDLDGDLDLFLVNLAGAVGPGDAAAQQAHHMGASHHLYRNDGGHFTDVSRAAGVDFRDLGLGACAGDYDGDGLIDLYITCYGQNRLLRNLGQLRFEDVTEKAGVAAGGFSCGATFADVDRDGDLDLYVCNYVRFRWNGAPPAQGEWGGYSVPYTINPSSFPAARNRFFRNRGDGTFEEEAQKLGIDDPHGRSLGVVCADFNGDGWPDLYVLNDVSKNAYFENTGTGTFQDRSLDSLAADYRGAMGNAVADLDGDGDLDLFITHWIAQENGLFINLLKHAAAPTGGSGACEFSDEADAWGLGQISLDYVGWGTAFLDYDLDGLLDLVVVNGSTMESEQDSRRLVAQRPLLFWHKAKRGFFELGSQAGKPWSETWNARGLAAGDLDGDGDLDLVIASNRGPVRILENQGTDQHWLRVRLKQVRGNRLAVGAEVVVQVAGRRCLQVVGAGTSYLSQGPLALTFGLGSQRVAERVEVLWPDGSRTQRTQVAGDRVLTLEH